MNAQQAKSKLESAIAAKSTEMLINIARQLNLETTTEEIMVCCAVERELEKRLSKSDFLSLMKELETELEAA